MFKHEKSVIPQIEAFYTTFSPTEKIIADFFIHNQQQLDFSAKKMSEYLFVSMPSLSRFAKKCGYKGYREFIFHYKEGLSTDSQTDVADIASLQVLNTYQEILNKSYALVKEEQLNRLTKILSEHKRIFIYGKGSSGLAGQEMKLRFMRIGVDIDAITDNHIMAMNSVLLNDSCTVIGISVSGSTPEIITALKAAKSSGATVILMTSHLNPEHDNYCDEIVPLALRENIENGKTISPQFPILVICDMIYSHFLKYDTRKKEDLHDITMDFLHKE